MKKLILFLLGILLLLPAISFAGYSETSPNVWTSTPDYASVQGCVDDADFDSGDTLNVTAGDGTETWSSQLAITKGIKLIGPGKTNLTITSGTNSSTELINWSPTSYSETLELSGFTFDCNNVSPIYELNNYQSQYAITGVKIHDNDFLNVTGAPKAAVVINGPVFGVVYHNRFTGNPHMDNYFQDDCDDWLYWGEPTYGTADNMFYEDNEIITGTTICTMGHGGRYLYRYNTITLTTNLYPLWDMHGNQTAGVVGSVMGEIYGNKVSGAYSTSGLQHRGGQMLYFYNQMTLSGFSNGSYNEYANSINCSGAYEMEQENSYYWNNRNNGTLYGVSPYVYRDLTATGGGNDYIDDAQTTFALCTSTCYYHRVIITGGTGVGQERVVHSVIDRMTLDVAPGGAGWSVGDTITGVTSGTTCEILEVLSTTSYKVKFRNASYTSGEVLTNGTDTADQGLGYPSFSQIYNRIYVTPDWDTSPDETSVFDIEKDCCDEIDENVNYFNHNASFDGTVNNSGMGAGTLANRPAVCVTGQGYWATDQAVDSVADAQVGMDATTPISGTLYICGATGWADGSTYTPYTYPHPLTDQVAPTISSFIVDPSGSFITMTGVEVLLATISTGLTMTSDGGAVTLTYASGSGTTGLVYSTSRTILSTENITYDYTQPGNGIEDASGNDLASISSGAVTNSSTQSGAATGQTTHGVTGSTVFSGSGSTIYQ